MAARGKKARMPFGLLRNMRPPRGRSEYMAFQAAATVRSRSQDDAAADAALAKEAGRGVTLLQG